MENENEEPKLPESDLMGSANDSEAFRQFKAQREQEIAEGIEEPEEIDETEIEEEEIEEDIEEIEEPEPYREEEIEEETEEIEPKDTSYVDHIKAVAALKDFSEEEADRIISISNGSPESILRVAHSLKPQKSEKGKYGFLLNPRKRM